MNKFKSMKKLLILGLAGIFASGLASCTRDADSNGWAYGTPLDKDQSFFANINICGTEAMTRAALADDAELLPDNYDPSQEPSFGEGTTDENKVTTIYLIFYDENGDRVATTQVRKDNQNTAHDGRNDSENSFYSGVVQIDVKHGSLPPAYVMAFVNPITSTNFEINPNFATLTELEKTTRPRIIDDNNNFAMSKSVYYGTNRVTGEKNQRIMATPLGEGKLFTTSEAAKAAMDADTDNNSDAVVDIYVERYAAKVNFSIASDANKGITVDEHTLTFVPEFWAVNAYESNTYITKSFFKPNEQTGELDAVLTYDEMNDALRGSAAKAWYWNSPEHHRCYWAQSPAYYMENYPRVADDITDAVSYAAGGFALGYYSYNDMVTNADGSLIAKARKLTDNTDAGRPIYARENTVAGKALIAAYEDPYASPKAAIASVALVGHYELNGKKLDDNEFFYVMGNATNGYSFFEDDDDMLNYFVRTTIPFAKNANGTQMFFNYNNMTFTDNTYKKYFKIEHPGLATRGELVIDSRFVTIQLDPSQITDNTPLYALIDGEYTQVTTENIDLVNQQMLYAAGTVQGFNGGKAYFTIPIKHLGFYRSDNANKGKNANDKDFDWTEVQSGDFGLVRNHIYSIIVDNINGLGNAIPNPDDPIVPPTDPEEYFIGARIIVLNWAVVPTQHVTL